MKDADTGPTGHHAGRKSDGTVCLNNILLQKSCTKNLLRMTDGVAPRVKTLEIEAFIKR